MDPIIHAGSEDGDDQSEVANHNSNLLKLCYSRMIIIPIPVGRSWTRKTSGADRQVSGASIFIARHS